MARTAEITKTKAEDGIIEYKLSHWKHFTKFISRDLLDYPGYIYRGQSSSRWKLESSYDRLIRNRKANPSLTNHLTAFKNMSKGRRGKNPPVLLEDNEWWAIAQHYGLSTPLLDFTKSPFVGLYFAFCDTGSKYKERAVYAFHYNSVSRLKKDKNSARNIHAFYPSSDENERLINQSGLFLKMPLRTNLESEVKKHCKGHDRGILLKIKIPNTDAQKCITMLNRMNINHATLFPDLYGAAKYVNSIVGNSKFDTISKRK